jgi:exopolysaccharide production protein ExoZ
MRYVAALAVASHHLLGRLDITAYAPSTPLTNLGTLGIFVFFILSGFLITYTIGRKAAADERYGLGQYLTERFVRIYLVLLPAMLLAAVVTLIATRGDIGNFGVDWSHFNVRNFLITLLMLSGVPGFLPHAETFVLLGPSWTLNYEFFFYIVLGALLLPARSLQPALSWAIRILLVTIFAGLLLTLTEIRVLGFAWVLGSAIAFVFRSGVRMRTLTALLACSVAVFAYLIAKHQGSPLIVQLADPTLLGALFAIGLFWSETFVPGPALRRVVSELAGFSYSLYLTHLISMWLFTIAMRPTQDAMIRSIGPTWTFVVILGLLNLAAYLFSLATERHNERARRALLDRLKLGRMPVSRVAATPVSS